MVTPFRLDPLCLLDVVAELVERGFTEDDAKAEILRVLPAARLSPTALGNGPALSLPPRIFDVDLSGLAKQVPNWENSTVVLRCKRKDGSWNELTAESRPVEIKISMAEVNRLWPQKTSDSSPVRKQTYRYASDATLIQEALAALKQGKVSNALQAARLVAERAEGPSREQNTDRLRKAIKKRLDAEAT